MLVFIMIVFVCIKVGCDYLDGFVKKSNFINLEN